MPEIIGSDLLIFFEDMASSVVAASVLQLRLNGTL